MSRFYDPVTGTEALEGIHDTQGATPDTDMPQDSREWFTRPAKEGYRWETDPTGKFPVEVPIPPPTSEERKTQERAWVQGELRATDAALVKDSPYSEDDQTKIETYRQALRNPAREQTEGFPADSWRPTFPAGVKRPGE